MKSIIVTFKHGEFHRFLFRVTNIGNDEHPDLKFTFAPKGTIVFWGDENIEKSKIWDNHELTYHPDGSLLIKKPNYPIKNELYTNPYGIGSRIMPLNGIKDFQLIALIEIQSPLACAIIHPNKENDNIYHCCKNQYVFENESFSGYLYIKNRKFKANLMSTPKCYSYIQPITSILDVGMVFQKRIFSSPSKRYSEIWKRWYYPYNMNRWSACSEEAKEIVFEDLKGSVFSSEFYDFLSVYNNNSMFEIFEEEYDKIMNSP